MDSQTCLTQLKTQFLKDVSQRDNLFKLTTDAWGKEKYACLDQIASGSLVQLSSLLNSFTPKG